MVPVVAALGSLDGVHQVLVGGLEGLHLPGLLPEEPPPLPGLQALLVLVPEGLQQLAMCGLSLLLCLLQRPADLLYLRGGGASVRTR